MAYKNQLHARDRAYWNASKPVRQLLLGAASALQDIPIGEWVEFDYKGRGYHLTDE